MKEFNFIIKKGVYCSWCAELLKKSLQQHFEIKEVSVNFPKDKIHVIAYKRPKSKDIIIFLKKRGYHIVEEK